jgi:hypothetical protein
MSLAVVLSLALVRRALPVLLAVIAFAAPLAARRSRASILQVP